MGSITLVTGAT